MSVQESYAYLLHAGHQPGSRLRAVPTAQVWANFLIGERDIGEEMVRAAMQVLAAHYLAKGQDDDDADSVIGVPLDTAQGENDSEDESEEQDSSTDSEDTDGGSSSSSDA